MRGDSFDSRRSWALLRSRVYCLSPVVWRSRALLARPSRSCNCTQREAGVNALVQGPRPPSPCPYTTGFDP